MENKYLAISDGTFTLQESENKNQFYFYRNDGEILTDIGSEPMDLYQNYIIHKMMSGEITGMVIGTICSEMSDDKKCIRLTIKERVEEIVLDTNDSTASGKKTNFLKRLFHKIFG